MIEEHVKEALRKGVKEISEALKVADLYDGTDKAYMYGFLIARALHYSQSVVSDSEEKEAMIQGVEQYLTNLHEKWNKPKPAVNRGAVSMGYTCEQIAQAMSRRVSRGMIEGLAESVGIEDLEHAEPMVQNLVAYLNKLAADKKEGDDYAG